MKWGVQGCIVCVAGVILLAGCAVNPAERNNAGNVLYQQGDFAGASAAYALAEVSAPDQPEPYYNAASALAQAGDLETAVAALNQALKTADEPLQAQAYYNLGNVYYALGQFEEAVSAYQQTLLLHPDDADARYNLELALRRIPPPSDDNGGAETPTPESGDSSQQTPTPDQSTTAAETATPTPENALSPQDAERLLDSAAQNQQV
ncbi:MAG: tetratricopeptide repeat protein, partial [Anaerolineae bacterium]|nr:tetratricopeptide repeat protein [Anaerolineae bacterium]